MDPAKYALHLIILMDVLFKDEEIALSCYVSSHRTKKRALDPDRVALLKGALCIFISIPVFMHVHV